MPRSRADTASQSGNSVIEQRRQRAEKRAYKERQAGPVSAPERALIEAPAEHREGWIAIIRSRHSGRPECAQSTKSLRSSPLRGGVSRQAGSKPIG